MEVSNEKHETVKSDADRALAVLLPATNKFTEQLRRAVSGRESCWHRLNVRVAKGRIASVQLIHDEQFEIIDTGPSPEDAG